ncbi:MAG: FAD:protein FMN transferase [Pseudomonadota bacterium]
MTLFTPHASLLTLLVLFLLAGCTRPPLYQQESFVFGTRVEVLVYGLPEAQARAAVGEVLREFDRLHRMLHPWQPSEVTALNAALARGEPAVVSPELAAILGDAQAIAASSDQLFNPAIGKLVALWGFHSEEFRPRLPDPEALARLTAVRPTMADLEIAGARVASGNRALQLDLGGYAKGYALDRAADILRARGVHNALINIGGNVLALGRKGDQPWRVGIQHPRGSAPLATLSLYDGEAIGTSGDYQRYFELDGRRYSHLIDPRSGRPAQGTQAVTVLITPRPRAGTLSDAASKPLFIAGADRWRDYARRLGVEHVLRVGADGGLTVTRPMLARLSFAPEAPRPAVVD